MDFTGGCYCRSIRYRAQGESPFSGQCHCRECQYLSGGHPNVIIAMPEAGFSYSSGTPKGFRRKDLDDPVTREFCPECGTHILTKSPRLPGMVLIKIGTLDDPGLWAGPQMIIQTADKQSFHHVPEGIPAFERFPG